MTWEKKETNIVHSGLQDRFEITRYQLDFFSEEFQSGLDSVDYLRDSETLAKDLLSAISDHLSRRNLRDIIKECARQLDEWPNQ